MNINDCAEKYGESIDNLSTEVLLEAIYNERYAHNASVLQQREDRTQEDEESQSREV